jgi:hypothetical protein
MKKKKNYLDNKFLKIFKILIKLIGNYKFTIKFYIMNKKIILKIKLRKN